MKRWIRVPLALCLAGALTVVLCRRPDGPAEDLPARAPEELVDGFPETVALRSLAKRQLAREAAEGRRSLLEAAALFGELNRLPPETPPVRPDPAEPPAPLPGGTEAERLCQQVVAFARVALADRPPAEAQAAVARLVAEFRAELGRHGAVRLPDPSCLTPVHEILEQVRQATTAAERQALFGPRQQVPGIE